MLEKGARGDLAILRSWANDAIIPAFNQAASQTLPTRGKTPARSGLQDKSSMPHLPALCKGRAITFRPVIAPLATLERRRMDTSTLGNWLWDAACTIRGPLERDRRLTSFVYFWFESIDIGDLSNQRMCTCLLLVRRALLAR